MSENWPNEFHIVYNYNLLRVKIILKRKQINKYYND